MELPPRPESEHMKPVCDRRCFRSATFNIQARRFSSDERQKNADANKPSIAKASDRCDRKAEKERDQLRSVNWIRRERCCEDTKAKTSYNQE